MREKQIQAGRMMPVPYTVALNIGSDIFIISSAAFRDSISARAV